MIGRKGSGKTTQLCRLLSQPDFGSRCVLIDPTDSIEFGVEVEDLRSLAVQLERQAQRRFRLRYSQIQAALDFGNVEFDPNYWKIEAIIQACLDVGGCTLAIDEVDMFCNPYGIPPTFKHLLARGRHDSLNLLWTARRPQEVSKMLLAQSDEFYLFQMHHPADVDYFRQFMAFEPEQVRSLEVGQFLHWKVGDQAAYASPIQDRPERQA